MGLNDSHLNIIGKETVYEVTISTTVVVKMTVLEGSSLYTQSWGLSVVMTPITPPALRWYIALYIAYIINLIVV